MLSESVNNAARYMRVAVFMVLAHAVLLVAEGSWMMLNHKPHTPHYHNHHVHDACHSLAFVLAVVLGFYALIILLISFTKEARSEHWALRVLGLPNFAFILITAINLIWLALQYEEHDEHWFVFNLQLACATGLFYICYFLFAFTTNALATGKSYAKYWLLILSIPISAVALLFYYENLPIHKWIGLATLLPFIAALLTAQRTRITKTLKQL